MMRFGMQLDLESLLSSSPPGFGLNLDIRNSFIRADERPNAERKQFSKAEAKWHPTVDSACSEPGASDCVSLGHSTWMSEKTLQRIATWETHYQCDQDRLDSIDAVERSRKVSFADDLESVFVIDELPDDLPLTLSTGSLDEQSADDGGVALDEPTLTLNFTQPAADYLLFRNTVDAQFVSLANAIVKDCRLTGTVRVKNVAFEKSVVVRYSFDGWATYDDAPAAFNQCDAVDERFDTFTFAIDCPSHPPSPGARLQFAVRYTAAGVEYWDSNRGDNYEVLYVGASAVDGPPRSHNPVFSRQSDRLWSEYSVWSDIDASSPYW